MSQTQRGLLYGLLAAAIWGGMYVVSDQVLRVIPPFTLLTIRLLLGALTLAVILGIRYQASGSSRQSSTGDKVQGTKSQDVKPNLENPIPTTQYSELSTKNSSLALVLVGLLGFGVSVGAQFVGTDLSDAVNGALITSASPAFILIFAALILRERLTARHIAAVVLATIGVIVIVDPAQADFSSAAFAGNVTLVFAALTWGLFSVLSRRVGQARDTLVVTLWGFVGGLLLTIPAAFVELQSRTIGDIDGGVILGIFYLGVVSTAGAMWLWNRAFALVDAATASLTFFAQPLVGALLAAAIGQQITQALVIGGILIAVGVLLAMRRTDPTTT
ncbi:MAG: EamA family transporter [Chloroflexota bacterium]|nr:EamA family transporter [Chloroflexota bacterium]